MEGEHIGGPNFNYQLEFDLALALLSIGLYYQRSEVGRVEMAHYLDTLRPNQEGQVGLQVDQEEEEVEDSEEEGAGHQERKISARDQEDVEGSDSDSISINSDFFNAVEELEEQIDE